MSQKQAVQIGGFTAPGKAWAPKAKKVVDIVDLQEKDNAIFAKIKGFKEDPNQVVTLATQNRGEVFLEPYNGQDGKAPAKSAELELDDEQEEEAEATPVEETPAEEETPEEEPTEAEPEEEKTEVSEEDQLRIQWMKVFTTTDDFDSEAEFDELIKKGKISVVREILARLNKVTAKVKRSKAKKETDWSTAKLNKYFENGEYVPALDFMEQRGIITGDSSEEEMTNKQKEVFDILAQVTTACQYSGDTRRVKAETINSETPKALALIFTRLASAYPTLRELNLVEDVVSIEPK